MQILTRKKIDSEETLGTFIGREYYDTLITEDCDLYAETIDGVNSEANLIFKYRKNVFTPEEQAGAYAGLREAATESQNRGMAAGPRGEILSATKRGGREWVSDFQLEVLDFFMRPANALDDSETIDDIIAKHKDKGKAEDTRGYVWLRSRVLAERPKYEGWFTTWIEEMRTKSREDQFKEAEYIKNRYISVTNYAQSVMSGIAGYYDRYPRIPYGRATAYTAQNPEKFALAYPFLHKLNSQFQELIPNRWANQKMHANQLDPKFVIDDTVFTTLTVNHNWRTACHRDAGDLTTGFSNICGITGPDGKGWRGAEFILPEFRIAINLQPGDMLLVNNHEGIHGNAPLSEPVEDNDRLTLVAYFRENMLNLKSYEYENLRKQFIDERRLNKDHPEWRPLWNGVSPKVFESEEWRQYLIAHNMEDEDGLVDTGAGTTLEDFFG